MAGRDAFRRLLAERRAVMAASLIDPLSARLAQQVGYEAGTLLSSAATLAVLGDPDLSLLSLTEMAEQTRRVCRACTLPVLVDGEQGFGNALNARRTVEEIEAAGAAAVTIEDTVLPRAFGVPEGYALVSEAEGVGKIRAALSGRRDPAFLVIARTSALGLTTLDHALSRIVSYVQAGADAVYLAGVKDVEHLQAVRSAVTVPILVGAMAPTLRDVDLLRAQGVSLWAQGQQPITAALHAMEDRYRGILAGTAEGAIGGGGADPLLDCLARADLYRRWAKDFLS